LRIAITQPTYLPWLGYFDLIDQVDTFVLLDNVQFEKQSWQNRNRIKTPAGLQWLSVPVVLRKRLGQKISEVEISDPGFWFKHMRAVEVNYGRAPFFETYFPQLLGIVRESQPRKLLLELNVRLLNWLMGVLGVRTTVITASSTGEQGKRTELLANVCGRLGARQYISPLGSAVYLLQELCVLTERGVDVLFQNYDHPEYTQRFPPFIPYASVLDLIFNEGERSLEIIRSGRRPLLSPEQVSAKLAQGQQA
jgi:hypothetical protein